MSSNISTKIEDISPNSSPNEFHYELTPTQIQGTPPLTQVLMNDNKATGLLSWSGQRIETIKTPPIKHYIGSDPSPKINTQDTNKFYIFINKISQVNTLQGVRAQSVKTRHFYPRSYMPGNYQIEGIAKSQVDYQNLANFIREHHKKNMIGGLDLTIDKNNVLRGYNYLMRLQIPNEKIDAIGWIPKFSLDKKGVFAPVPS